VRAQLRAAARRLRHFMTDPELPVSAGAPLIESLSPTRNLTLAIHEGFTSIHHAPLVDHVSREPQRVAGRRCTTRRRRAQSPRQRDRRRVPQSHSKLFETTNSHVALTHRPLQGYP